MLALARRRVPELMDEPDVPHEEHQAALSSLETINRISLAARAIAIPIRSLGADRLTMLDVACGGGDVPVSVAQLLRRRRISIRLILCDKSDVALRHAHEKAAKGAIECEVLRVDVDHDELPPADVVTNSLFLHHLDREQATAALSKFARAARQMVIVNDLRRSAVGWTVAWSMTRLLSSSRIVQHDGPVSVRAAWRIEEMRQMASEAGLRDVGVRRCWPWRMLLEGRGGLR